MNIGIVSQLITQISQGSAATDLRRGGVFYSSFFRSLSVNVYVKELLKSIITCQSYSKDKSSIFIDYGVQINHSVFLLNRRL